MTVDNNGHIHKDKREDSTKHILKTNREIMETGGIPVITDQSNAEKQWERRTTVAKMLHECITIFEEKNKEYGDIYKKSAGACRVLFPDGVTLKTKEDFSRFSQINMMMTKLLRYAKNFHEGGHEDSLKDLAIYSAMLREIDANIEANEDFFKGGEI